MYSMSLFSLPVDIANCIEKLQRDFLLRGGMSKEFKFHVLNWSKVCFPILEGGLGVQNLQMLNHALLRKWLWYNMHKRDLVESCCGC
jgi:hypothetical protein